MGSPEVAGLDPRLVLYDRRHADVFELWLKRLGDPDAAEDAAQWVLLGGANGDVEAPAADLSVAARTALLLRERDGLSYAQVAERLGVAEPTAKRVVYVARLRLVEALRRLGHTLHLAPLLGWLKTAAGGLTVGKGVAVVATIGAAVGLSVSAIATRERAPEPSRPGPTQTASVVPTRVERSSPTVQRVTPPQADVPRLVLVEAPPGAPARPAPSAERTSDASPIVPSADSTVPGTVAVVGETSKELVTDAASGLPAVEAPALPELPAVPPLEPPALTEPALPLAP